MSVLVTLLIYLIILAIIWWVIRQLPLPEPIRLVAIGIVAIVAILLLFAMLEPGIIHLPKL